MSFDLYAYKYVAGTNYRKGQYVYNSGRFFVANTTILNSTIPPDFDTTDSWVEMILYTIPVANPFSSSSVFRWTATTNTSKIIARKIGSIDSNDNVNITHDKPLHEQCTLGFLDTNDTKTLGKGDRHRRSLHNFPIKYSPGRHYAQSQTYNDLYIFYYGYAILNEQAIARKVQIRDKMSEKERKTIPSDHPNNVTSESFLNKISRNINPRSKDIAVEIEPIIKLHQTLTGERF
jgi:hypothetical protein